MITGDIKLGTQYRDMILEQIKEEIKPSNDQLQRIFDRLNRSSSDGLEWAYEAFERFRVATILKCIRT